MQLGPRHDKWPRHAKALGIGPTFLKASANFSSCCLVSLLRRQSLTSPQASSLRSLSSAWSREAARVPPAMKHEAKVVSTVVSMVVSQVSKGTPGVLTASNHHAWCKSAQTLFYLFCFFVLCNPVLSCIFLFHCITCFVLHCSRFQLWDFLVPHTLRRHAQNM